MSIDLPILADTRPLLDMESIIAAVKPATAAVTICLDGDLRSEWERLEAQLGTVSTVATNLAGDSPGAPIAARMAELVEQMHEFERTFVVRAVTPRRAWRNLLARRPVKADGMDDEAYLDLYHPWLCTVVATSLVDPPSTREQVERFADKLSDGDWQKLAQAAWNVNENSAGIPFSVAASVLTRSSGAKSKQPETSDNPAHGSLAGNPDPSPSTSETSTDE